MRKNAEVIEVINDKSVKVCLFKHNKCSGCGNCNKNIHPGSLLLAENKIGAKISDKVLVNIFKKINVFEIFVVYLMPTMLVLLGLWIGSLLIKVGAPDFIGLLLGGMMLVFSIIVYFKTKHLYAPKYNITLLKILSK
jgi:positive regulator of sigma E activity